jgi:dTDP-4-dehydrorhamnose reductase
MKKVLVLGANGQLGNDICRCFENKNIQVIGSTHDQADILDFPAVERLIQLHQPDCIINTTAYHNVELCEQNPDMAAKVNADAPAYLSELSLKYRFKFIHISTDYVFDGKKNSPYTETDPAHPLNVYGKTKLLGEQLILAINDQNLVVRVSGLYGLHPCRAKNGLNFVQLMLKLAKERGSVKVVTNEMVSPTYTANVAEQLYALLDSSLCGIVHATSEGSCSWYEFAEEIFNYSHTPVELGKANSNDFPAKVERPVYSVLENKKLKDHQLNRMLHWKIALHQYLDALAPAS